MSTRYRNQTPQDHPKLDKVAQIFDALEGEARDDEGNFPAMLANLIE
jgi:hypothetical protein